MNYATDREDTNPVYDDCPVYCPDNDTARSSFCDSCEIKELREQFKSEAIAELETMPGEQFGFDYLNKCVVESITIRSLPRDRWTIQTARFVEIIDAERARIRRIRDWNKKQETPPGGDS